MLKILSGDCGDNLSLKEGHVYLNGYLTSESQRRKSDLILYIEQDESFIETMTIEEHLIFQVNHFN